MKLLCKLLVVFILSFLTACGKPELTRTDAEKLLSESEHLGWTKSFVRIADFDAFVRDGRQLGIRTSENGSKNLSVLEQAIRFGTGTDHNNVGYVTLSGDPLLQVVDPKVVSVDGRKKFVLRNPVTTAIEVTGIKTFDQGSTSRIANFRWRPIGLPAIVKRFANDGGTGTATFQLYDDGWRIDNVEVVDSDDQFVLSAAENAALDVLQSIELKNQADRERVIDAKRQRLSEARKETSNVEVVRTNEAGHRANDFYPREIKISNSHIGFLNQETNRWQRVWFGNIVRMSIQKAGRFDGPDRNAKILLTLSCIELQHPQPNGFEARPAIKISPNDVSEFSQKFNSALKNWRKSHPEFADTHWYAELFGKPCSRIDQ